MSGWSVATMIVALVFLNALIILVSIALAPYHTWRLLRAVARRVARASASRRSTSRADRGAPLAAD